ncbi:MAG: UDP-N-acetylmuramate--L-alanine ligase [Thermicanus sp.]|nr:UDP-N-acetylmuramate--L-alanine ligase [Thermicanus sp.]
MSDKKRIHFIGIGGSGMSALARVCLEQGYSVSGSDMVRKNLVKELEQMGATVYIGHHPDHVKGADLVVYTSDIPEENAELAEAKRLLLPVMHRSDLLAEILNGKKGIAVSGSHGKTTTTSLISFLLEKAGFDPTYIIGGEMLNGGGNARAGQGEYVVAEADESDRTFLKYHPHIGVITNIEPDHLENYEEDYRKMKEAFLRFANQVKPGGKAVICLDDPDIREIASHIKSDTITYGMKEEKADYLAREIDQGDGLSFLAVERGKELGRITLHLAGRHNIYNALAALAVARYAGISFDTIAAAMAEFRGAKRRFQLIGEVDQIQIVDDYAVHPTEIRATLQAAKETGRRVLALFQPHRVTRAYYLFGEFGRSFQDADRVYITEIYSPKGDKKIEGVNSGRLAEEIRKGSGVEVQYISSQEEMVDALLQEAKPGDLILTLGAGDIYKVANRLIEELSH